MNRRVFMALCGAVAASIGVPALVTAPKTALISNPHLTETTLRQLERICVRSANINGKKCFWIPVHPARIREGLA